MIVIPVKDLRQNGERRIVHDHAALRILFFLVVAARVKRSDHLRGLHTVLIGHPFRHGLVDGLRRVAVVGRLLDLELLQELVVLLVSFLPAVIEPILAVEKRGAVHPFDHFIVEDAKAERGHVEIRDIEELQTEQIRVPLSELAGLVVRQAERVHLFRSQVVRDHAGNRPELQLLRGLVASMASDDHAVPVDHDRNLEPELLYTGSDVVDSAVILPRILIIWPYILQLFVDYSHEKDPFCPKLNRSWKKSPTRPLACRAILRLWWGGYHRPESAARR